MVFIRIATVGKADDRRRGFITETGEKWESSRIRSNIRKSIKEEGMEVLRIVRVTYSLAGREETVLEGEENRGQTFY